MDELVKAIDEIGRDDEVKVVILTGSGRAFCAGGDVFDLPLFYMSEPGKIREFLQTANKIPLSLRNLRKPVIAGVNGAAVGAGFSLAMACDIIIASFGFGQNGCERAKETGIETVLSSV